MFTWFKHLKWSPAIIFVPCYYEHSLGLTTSCDAITHSHYRVTQEIFCVVYITKISDQFEIFIDILFRYKHVLTICQQSILSTPFTENYVLSCATTKNHYILSLTKILKRCKGEEYHMCFFARKYVIIRFLSKWKELDWTDINTLFTLL